MAKNFVTHVQVRNTSLVMYDYPETGFDQPAWRKPPSKKGYSGYVTDSTKKRIQRAIDIFLQVSPTRWIHNPVTDKKQKFKLSFITLTISRAEPVEAREGHKALKVFLQHFKKPWSKRKISEPMKSYLWKAELQERGQLHYHLTTNVFLHFAEIRRVWNDIQHSRGWLDDYHAAFKKWDANSTDVHAVHKIKDIGRYLTKYLCKQEFKVSPANPEAGYPALMEPIRLNAKVWGCSEDLKGAKRFDAVMDMMTWATIVDAYGSGNLKVVHCENSKFIDHPNPTNLLSPSQLNQYNQWKKSIVSPSSNANNNGQSPSN